jgi:hypothetical protein
MARRSARPEAGEVPKPLFSVVVGEASLAHLLELLHGTVVAPGAVLPWLRDCDIEGLVFAGPDRVVGVSRKRSFSGAVRRIVEVRDRRCGHASCDQPAERCQVDHVIPYSAGGLTCQSNGRLGCGFHNRLWYARWRASHPPRRGSPEHPPPDRHPPD